MLDVTMEMEQYDCPFIDTTADHEVAFSTMHWRLDAAREELETRLLVEGADRGALDNGLSALREHGNMNEYQLFSRQDDTAVVRTVIEQTNAMTVIHDRGGYITGPFQIRNGQELWQVGFDDGGTADETLYALDKNNEFHVERRRDLELDQLFDVLGNVEAAGELLDACRSLSDVERRTIRRAADAGYFETPRDATLSTLADEFDVSTTAVSKNMRRGEKKLLRSLVDALERLDETD
ncbi:helix-turn-helix domain-containing protein [Natronomonas salina]|uniref:helix-turn-helix domain-containing protein n=1 Tax=Natronomonas salina TaxID=1710540 RepID=UPI0015B54677|nr:helix-turn-helix domain-containing protein [Natronomonas salina]QLD90069.1 helix-turn-helix domain-containing protein [Natronomonas salina]